MPASYAGWYSTDPFTSILRLAWNGCPVSAGRAPASPPLCHLAGGILHVTGGPHEVRLRDASGRLARVLASRSGARHRLESGGAPGIYLVEVVSEGGRWTGKTALAGP